MNVEPEREGVAYGGFIETHPSRCFYWVRSQMYIHFCQTKVDDDLFNSGSVVSSDGKRLRYSPSDSLPAYFYPRPDPDQPGDLAEFIKPAVMLQVSLRLTL